MAGRRANGNAEPADTLVDQNTLYDTSKEIKAQLTFDKILKNQDVLRGAYNFGFEKPSAIQQRAIAPILAGRDLIAQAQSGTGKTTMIALATCEMIDIRTNEYATRWQRLCLCVHTQAVQDACDAHGCAWHLPVVVQRSSWQALASARSGATELGCNSEADSQCTCL